MSAPVTTRRWETREYARIVAAQFLPPHLLVTFADGTVAELPVDRIDNGYVVSQRPDWSRVRAGVHELLIPTETGEVGIPWDAIRALTDPDFAAYWAERAAGVAARIGERLRDLRDERRFDVEDVARRAGLSVATVAELEAGRQPVDLAAIDRVLAAVGCTADDLVADPSTVAG